jgi:hypothetical protein
MTHARAVADLFGNAGRLAMRRAGWWKRTAPAVWPAWDA